MKKIKQCLILVAGNGTRLRPVSAGLPKPLVQFRGKPILEHVILRARQAGIEEFVIVVGYRSYLIRRWLANRWLGDVSVTLVENPDYHKSNGVSVLKDRVAECRSPHLARGGLERTTNPTPQCRRGNCTTAANELCIRTRI